MSALKAIENRVRAMIARAIVRLVDDAKLAQELQLDLLADEGQDGVERLQNYGFTAHPHPGAEAIVCSVGGLRSHLIALVVADRRYRLTGLQSGEVAIYDDLGNLVKLGRDRIEVVAASELQVTAPQIALIGQVAITGDLTVTGEVTASGIDLSTHLHSGVRVGTANSGGPL